MFSTRPHPRGWGGGDRPGCIRAFSGRSAVLATEGMACSSHPFVSQTAVDILKSGGNAVDAAIAANAVQGVVEPMSCGLGGDLFAIISPSPTAELVGLNSSGCSPESPAMAAELAALSHVPQRGPLSVTTPGAVAGWFALHERFGTVPMAQLLEPAIRYASRGFPVSQVISEYWAGSSASFASPAMQHMLSSGGKFPEAAAPFRQTFLDAWGTARRPREGDVFRNADVAETMRRIAQGGRSEFYGGRIANDVERWAPSSGLHLAASDFAAHQSLWVDPVSTTYRRWAVYELPPNTQGVAALEMLNVLEGYDIGALGSNTAEAIHLMVEAKRLAFADRSKYYADPILSPAPLAMLCSKAYAEKRRALIDPSRAMAEAPPGDYPPALADHSDTVYISVADKARLPQCVRQVTHSSSAGQQSGMMVSLIQSNFMDFGSMVAVPGLGFPLQNRGALFALQRGHANAYAPRKRPLHTIIPGFARRGSQRLSFGVMGGDMQPQGHVQIISNLEDCGMGLQEAGDCARWRHESATGVVHLESGVPVETEERLRDLGHRVVADWPPSGAFGGYQAILRDDETGVLRGASEMRRDGCAIGY